jgi:hypothetical protein
MEGCSWHIFAKFSGEPGLPVSVQLVCEADLRRYQEVRPRTLRKWANEEAGAIFVVPMTSLIESPLPRELAQP